MKTKIVIVTILLFIIIVLLPRNDKFISETILSVINPLKQSYQNFRQEITNKSYSYIFQKESIEKLNRENRVLKKQLLEQIHYIQQVKDVYQVLPDLSHLPIKNISITQTISYVKLNSFSQIILTTPKNLKEDKLYGLMQNRVVAGTARLRNNQLYGYLISDEKCRFSVFIGDTKAPGIAIGIKKNQMLVKFIPKWHKLKVGDKVITSGLDGIFFADIPVGVVKEIEVQSSYTVAKIETFSDIFHPKTFFLINDAKATLTQDFDSNKTDISKRYSIPNTQESPVVDKNITKDINTSSTISSIPKRIDQTQENIIEPKPIIETIIAPIKIKKHYKKRRTYKHKRRRKRKRKTNNLDLF